MRITILMALLLAGGPLLAEEPNKDQKTKATAAERAKDPNTKVVQTPFGPTVRATAEHTPKPERPALKDDPLLKVEESGDTVIFKRRTPFGEQVWRRKRSELTAQEKELIAARKPTEPVSHENKK